MGSPIPGATLVCQIHGVGHEIWDCGGRCPFLVSHRPSHPLSSPPLKPTPQSKGGILSKACDYIQELRQSNHRLSEELQGLDQLQMDNEVLRQQVSAGGGAGVCLRIGTGPHSLTAPNRVRWRS